MAFDLKYRGAPVGRFSQFDGGIMRALRDLNQWEVIGGRCGKCARVGWVEKRAVMAKIGNHFLINVERRLRCSSCKNRDANQLLLGMMDRNA